MVLLIVVRFSPYKIRRLPPRPQHSTKMLCSIAEHPEHSHYIYLMYNHQLQLVVKLHKNKPSRIAVKYTYRFQALKSYEELVSKCPNQSFFIKLEPRGKYVDLILISDQCGQVFSYKNLSYKPTELQSLSHPEKDNLPMEFVHIYSEANLLMIAKPFKQENFFRISSCEVISIL